MGRTYRALPHREYRYACVCGREARGFYPLTEQEFVQQSEGFASQIDPEKARCSCGLTLGESDRERSKRFLEGIEVAEVPGVSDLVMLQTKDGPKMVDLEPVGQWFGVHPTLETDGASPTWWTVSHLPSGYACGTGFATYRAACEAAERLEAVPVAWAEVRGHRDPLLLPHLSALQAAVRGQEDPTDGLEELA